MARKISETSNRQPTFEVVLEGRPDFDAPLAVLAFDVAGNLLDRAVVKDGAASLSLSEVVLGRSRVFVAPIPEDDPDATPTLGSMERLQAFEPVVRKKGQLARKLVVPGTLVDRWILCLCWVRGRVVKDDSGRPVCGARVHICEVDKLWRWILRLPERDLLRLRDDFLRAIEIPPLRRPPRPEPDPLPFDVLARVPAGAQVAALGPQPEPPDRGLVAATPIPLPSPPLRETRGSTFDVAPSAQSTLSLESRTRLRSSSVGIVREALTANVEALIPYLCIWPWWWKFRCDEIRVLETDSLGRFDTLIAYPCDGDKPDLYFWVEYEIAGVWETVYHPPIPCATWWDYACGTEVTIRVRDERVPACDDEPDLPGCVVQVLSIGRTVSISELQGAGAPVTEEGLTTDGEPFGGKLEPRVWFSRTALRDGKNVGYYRWSYRRLTEGDGTPLATPGPWTPLTRTVVRHYAHLGPGGVTHTAYPLGPKPVGAVANLFEIKPEVPPGGIEWTVVDEREDLASAHFETQKLGTGDTACEQALDAAGKYELKLELFKDGTGALVDWTAEGIDLEIADVPAPFGTGTVTATSASAYNRVLGAGGHTMGFRMVVRVDNNCCEAALEPVTGTGVTVTPCGFIEFGAGATATLAFRAAHPNDFATFSFSVRRGVTDQVTRASASGETGDPSVVTDDVTPPLRTYTLDVSGTYRETFPVTELLGPCTRAAFSEALHVWTMATDGYGRLWHLDRFAHAGFALTPP
ncbi:MAG: hypothetical protein H6983_01275 [Ectothiorhodospiraceae bacterium]|nr:hypothetical protein [Ectothiorhodospiraceae bacterium]